MKDNLLQSREARVAAFSQLFRHAKLKMDISTDSGIRILKCCLSYAETPPGDFFLGQPYRTSKLLYSICDLLIGAYMTITSELNTFDSNYEDAWKKLFYYLQKALSILDPWRVQLDTKDSHRIDGLNEENINEIYRNLAMTEMKISNCYLKVEKIEKCMERYDRSIFHAEKLIEGEEKTRLLCDILLTKGGCLFVQEKYSEAKIVVSETYDLMATTYDLDHPLVLKAANQLVTILISNKEYYDAQRYATISYELLARSNDPESDDVADAAFSLAQISETLYCDEEVEGGTPEDFKIEFLEMLAKKSLRIKVCTSICI
jgi:tetratricopeptide (TPR) repeat protein